MTAAAEATGAATRMSHREVLEAMTGLMLSLFVAMLSATVVSNALPRILHDLHGSESAYTWVVTATLLTTTASTPLWGKFADLTSKKMLMQVALLIFIASSLVAGLSNGLGMLIVCRAFQGIGAGGIMAMTQVVMAALVSPRERGRYSGYIGATFAIATIAGPLIGGVIVDTPWLGWRWCFYVGIPFALAALLVLQKTLNLPVHPREMHIDYLGAGLIAGGVSALLIWVSLAGQQFGWLSPAGLALAISGAVLLAAALVVEARVPEPIIPLALFRERTVTLATSAGICIGLAMFGATIFLAQYFQIARGESPTMSGLLSMPMILGLATASLLTGRFVAITGRWKRFLVTGTVTAGTGFGLLGTLDAGTSMWLVGIYMTLIGIGIGMTVQNLVLAVQNTVHPRDLGAATATVTFFRMLGGAAGVAAMGAVLAHQVSAHVRSGLAGLGIPTDRLGESGTAIPDVRTLPPAVARIVEHAYGAGVGHIFLVATPLLAVAIVLVCFIKEVPLRQHSGTELMDHLHRTATVGEVSGAGAEPVDTTHAAAHR